MKDSKVSSPETHVRCFSCTSLYLSVTEIYYSPHNRWRRLKKRKLKKYRTPTRLSRAVFVRSLYKPFCGPIIFNCIELCTIQEELFHRYTYFTFKNNFCFFKKNLKVIKYRVRNKKITDDVINEKPWNVTPR